MSPNVAIVRTGVANTASVEAAFERLGVSVRLTEDPAAIRGASHVVLPGVGAFGHAIERLHARRLAEPLVERIQDNRATLAICLGLQLFCSESDESPGVPGLRVVPLAVARFSAGERVPHIGWNEVTPAPGSRYLAPGFAYFAHSYRLTAAPRGWLASRCDYGGEFVAAMERGRVLACQFHPELSGAWGLAVIERWLGNRAGEIVC